MNAPEPLAAPAAADAAQLRRMANALRMLAADAVQQANSGHPGAPLGMADFATVLWHRHLRHHPAEPQWPDRDRFVLSNGHASMLLYGLLHLSGYALPMDELKRFRQLDSKTPGHPEVGHTPGVETTTGPLGQGLANAVGMALAESLLAAEFNREGFAIVDHLTWVALGDGCLMEGISQEAISLAGTLGLGKLIALYDDNGISIDGAVGEWFADDTPARFRACGWQVIGPLDGHDPAALDAALAQARAQARQPGARPTLIVCRTTIGKGAIGHEGTAEVHGAPLGAAGVAALRAALDWSAPPFEVPPALAQAWDARPAGAQRHAQWQGLFAAYAQAHPALAADFRRRQQRALPLDFEHHAAAAVQALAEANAKPMATRRASQLALDALAPGLPELLGGSADLTGSNLTDFKGHRKAGPGRAGNYLSWGVREFGMAAALNGVALHGGFVPYGGTFLTFSDYSRNAIRMAALMRQRVVQVFTHDSIGVGEDGPTHQPIEHIASLRLIPGLDVWRPADGVETAVAWTEALARADGPSALVLSRQALPGVATPAQRADIVRGGYVLREAPADPRQGAMGGLRPRAVILATGSEVALALEAQARLMAEEGLAVRVVSMPCTQRFDAQGDGWCDTVLPPTLPVVAVEAGHPDGWRRYTGRAGAVIGIERFGASAPGPQLMAHFGFTVERVMAAVRQRVAVAARVAA
ncbi:transketolase [Aquabacterium sp. OR-4]|uniref:transketolase n=1 Tax=Aquabacterium sp. OR-4 TaxID=2978127 RepID=UPI0021B4521A|nr:transketolase [Aquabacterium sp. OR-4]MDT7836412.1 transketolase [Aquabacterium sp. OR-4]